MAKTKMIRKPAEVYKLCPCCKSKNLIRLEVDALCGDCDWMSCEEYVEAGGMDNLFEAFIDQFDIQEEALPALIAAQVLDQADITNPVPQPHAPLAVTELKCTPQTPLEIILGDPMELNLLFEEAPASA